MFLSMLPCTCAGRLAADCSRLCWAVVLMRAWERVGGLHVNVITALVEPNREILPEWQTMLLLQLLPQCSSRVCVPRNVQVILSGAIILVLLIVGVHDQVPAARCWWVE